jgi:quercetin dioxygenase-like cupin family protein
MPEAFVVNGAERPRALNVVGEQVTVLASGGRTGGYEVFHQKGPEGSGPPAHAHDWDESFYVVAGEVAFGMGERASVAKPGAFVHIPAGVTHWFRFGAGGGEMISLTSAAGASQLFADIDREVAGGPPDLEKLAAVAVRNGLRVAPPQAQR